MRQWGAALLLTLQSEDSEEVAVIITVSTLPKITLATHLLTSPLSPSLEWKGPQGSLALHGGQNVMRGGAGQRGLLTASPGAQLCTAPAEAPTAPHAGTGHPCVPGTRPAGILTSSLQPDHKMGPVITMLQTEENRSPGRVSKSGEVPQQKSSKDCLRAQHSFPSTWTSNSLPFHEAPVR